LELLGINSLPSIEISLKRKERIKESKSQLVLGYHDEKWNIITSTDRREEIENLKTYKGTTVISSLVNKGKIVSEDTLRKQLFQKYWFFSMKGDVNIIKLVDDIYNRSFPIFLENFVPNSDSEEELIFSIILEGISKIRYNIHEEKIALKLKEILSWIEPYGKICFLLSDGNSMFAYRSAPALYYNQVEKPLFSSISVSLDMYELNLHTKNLKKLVLISSSPKERENWSLMERGKVYCFCGGEDIRNKEKVYWR